jgi:serine kinase of HPr protein (carbohydrate metabolism regulator)
VIEESLNLHACCILLGEAGVLIRGASGAGKSSLARRLVSARCLAGGFAALVADDRVVVTRHHGRLVARPHPALAGLWEHRGIGIRAASHEGAAVLRLVLDLTAETAPRMPAAADLETTLLGVALPRVAGQAAEAATLVESLLSWQR